MKTRKKLILYEILSVITLVLPLLILLYIKRDEYLKVVTPLTMSLSGIICIVFAFLMVKDKLQFGEQRILKFLIFFIFCYVFEPFLADLKIISFVAFIGVTVNYILFENKIKQLKKLLDIELTATIIAQKTREGNNGE